MSEWQKFWETLKLSMCVSTLTLIFVYFLLSFLDGELRQLKFSGLEFRAFCLVYVLLTLLTTPFSFMILEELWGWRDDER